MKKIMPNMKMKMWNPTLLISTHSRSGWRISVSYSIFFFFFLSFSKRSFFLSHLFPIRFFYTQIATKKGLQINEEVYQFTSYAVQEHLRTILEYLFKVSGINRTQLYLLKVYLNDGRVAHPLLFLYIWVVFPHIF